MPDSNLFDVIPGTKENIGQGGKVKVKELIEILRAQDPEKEISIESGFVYHGCQCGCGICFSPLKSELIVADYYGKILFHGGAYKY